MHRNHPQRHSPTTFREPVMSMSYDPVDVLIIGAGASGSTAAKTLAEQGLSVVVLDQGHWTDVGDLPGDKTEYELLWNNHRYHPDPNMRNRREDYPTNLEDSEQPVYMYNGAGGSTLRFPGAHT